MGGFSMNQERKMVGPQARKAALISGLPSSATDAAAMGAEQAFDERTQGIRDQAEAYQTNANSQGFGNVLQLIAMLYGGQGRGKGGMNPGMQNLEGRSAGEMFNNQRILDEGYAQNPMTDEEMRKQKLLDWWIKQQFPQGMGGGYGSPR